MNNNNLLEENKRLQEEIVFLKKKIILITSLAFTDSLTGVINRRGMYQKIIDSKFNDYVIANCDLDNFKCVNDTLGHNIGDELLKNITSVINCFLGDDSFLVRFGGDEFLLFFTGEDISQSNELMEDIKSSIEMIGEEFYNKENKEIDKEKKLSVSTGFINYNSLDDLANYSMSNRDINTMDKGMIDLLFVDLDRCIKNSDGKLYSNKMLNKQKKEVEKNEC